MSTEEEILQVSVLPHMCSICPTCCVCHGCCAAEFGRSGRTYELPCIIVHWLDTIKTTNGARYKHYNNGGNRFFSSPWRPHEFCGSLNPLFNGSQGELSPRVNRPGHHHHPFPSAQKSAEAYVHPHTFPQGVYRKQFTYISITTCLEILVKLENIILK